MKDKKNIIAIILVIVTILVLLISNLLKEEPQKEKKEIKIVTNYSNFYTVSSCLDRTLNYLSKKDKDSVYYVLNDNYIKTEKITKENVLDVFADVLENSTFVSEKMYYEEINDKLTKYYVEGHIEVDRIYDDEEFVINSESSNYFIVYLDSENEIFSVEPYSGEIFKSGDLNG